MVRSSAKLTRNVDRPNVNALTAKHTYEIARSTSFLEQLNFVQWLDHERSGALALAAKRWISPASELIALHATLR
jgi:hypothetical protein